MTPERWVQIDALFQEALKRPLDQRSEFLSKECTDEATRKEVESLLSFHEPADNFLEVPAFEAAAPMFYPGEAEEITGRLIASYKIEALLGSGGMGEVYLAEDTKLGRKVAIKLLPAYLEADDLAKRRLVKEAKAAAKLTHPNICTIYEVVEAADRTFIAMQYVQGETLATRMQRSPLPLSESLEIAMQVADALVESHAQRIIHRDIKPQNIMIDSRAQVKVLDFGLAKTVPLTETNVETESQFSTPGIILGTVPYMSSEQAGGKSVDMRSDLFSLGTVLYQCVTGKLPFSGATAMETRARIIEKDPLPPSHFNPDVSSELDAIILKALAKDPDARYQSADDMLKVLRAARVQIESPDKTGWLKRYLRRLVNNPLATLRRLSRRTQVLSALAVLVIAVLISLMGYFGWRNRAYQPPAQALYHYNLGTAALRNGAYYDATLALQKATAADDKFPLAHAALAEAWLELGYADKANQELLRAASLSNEQPLARPQRLYLQAVTHAVLREFPAAIKDYQELIRQTTETEKAQAYVNLGRAYEKSNEVEKAIESYMQAAKLTPADVGASLRLGILYGERPQDIETALATLQQAESNYQDLRNFEGIGEVKYQRGLLFYNLGRHPEAKEQLEKVIEITGTTDNQYQKIKALALLSNVSANENNLTRAKAQATEAIDSARTNRIENQITAGLIWLGHISFLTGDYDEAEKHYKEALTLAQRDRDVINEAWAKMALGSLYTQRRNTKEALRYLEPIRLFYEQNGYRKWLATTLSLLGRNYRNLGDYNGASAAFAQMLQWGEQANDLSQVAASHEELGGLFAKLEQYKTALEHYGESYKINKSLNAQFNLGYLAMHRGSMLWQLGRREEAQNALNEAYAIAGSPDGDGKHLWATTCLVEACRELSEQEYEKAKAKSQQVLSLAVGKFKGLTIEAKIALGLTQTRSGAPRVGILSCLEAVDLAKTTDDLKLLSNALLAYAEALLAIGQTQQASETALQAQQSFARYEQQESEWRAWQIAAQAKRQSGEIAAAREYAAKGVDLLSTVEQKWGTEVFNGYIERPDIQHFRNQLNQIINPHQ
jgi:eukaryotic-like serine/threonine-protein kinase